MASLVVAPRAPHAPSSDDEYSDAEVIDPSDEDDDDDDDDDGTSSGLHEDERRYRLFKTWFERSARLPAYVPESDEGQRLRMTAYGEYTLRDDRVAAVSSSSSSSSSRPGTRVITDLVGLRAAYLDDEEESRRNRRGRHDDHIDDVTTFDRLFDAIFHEGLFPTEPTLSSRFVPGTNCSIWLSPHTFVFRGGILEDLEIISKGRLTPRLSLWVNLSPDYPHEYLTLYRARNSDDNITKDDNDGDDDGDDENVGLFLSSFARLSTWRNAELLPRTWHPPQTEAAAAAAAAAAAVPFLGPCTARAIVELARHPPPNGQARDVTFRSGFGRVSQPQWDALLQRCHQTTRLGFDVGDDGRHLEVGTSSSRALLLYTLRQKRVAPIRRLQIRQFDRFRPLNSLVEALAACKSVTDLSLVGAARRVAPFDSLMGAVRANRYLKALEVVHFLVPAEWERLWEVVAGHPSLSSISVGHDNVYGRQLRQENEPHGFDGRIRAIERAVKSNPRITSVHVMDETFRDHRHPRPARHSPDFCRRVLRTLQRNRGSVLADDVRSCPDPARRDVRFANSLLRLLIHVPKMEDWNGVPSCATDVVTVSRASHCFQLLRRNPEVLERAVRADEDVLRRNWNRHADAVRAHLNYLHQMERQMAHHGWTVPSSVPVPRGLCGKRKHEQPNATGLS